VLFEPGAEHRAGAEGLAQDSISVSQPGQPADLPRAQVSKELGRRSRGDPPSAALPA
jgi:hypothetical protein